MNSSKIYICLLFLFILSSCSTNKKVDLIDPITVDISEVIFDEEELVVNIIVKNNSSKRVFLPSVYSYGNIRVISFLCKVKDYEPIFQFQTYILYGTGKPRHLPLLLEPKSFISYKCNLKFSIGSDFDDSDGKLYFYPKNQISLSGDFEDYTQEFDVNKINEISILCIYKRIYVREIYETNSMLWFGAIKSKPKNFSRPH